ncbi:ATP-grasp fold amidoligase family protein [Thiohalophilus sp.]|uniref:ATP-grasp fold amidoligase family protein n=1 Tax=Thiohalophilus sp. TaxID=3028392 RepID=UPI002ACD8030|nr:ATP-grasp fold amidoligase family protein [Thiohalophilus sp.]MDZ7661084.1 ATP-grasp fold amidoligase family protein [Thiohalophilus sp.]
MKIKPIDKLIRNIRKKYYIHAYKKISTLQIEAIKKLPDSPFKKNPPNGYCRGIDFYEESDLRRILTLAMVKYYKKLGQIPDLINPKYFNEKILWLKFFSEIKIPESGNKLLTSHFIPEDLADVVQCPEIYWRTSVPRLPRNHEIKRGSYYIKATHGSGMYKQVCYPLDERKIVKLEQECKRWLARPFGLEDGEWWYNVFDREIIIDEDVVGNNRSTSYDFFVFNGKVEYILLHRKVNRKSGEVEELTRLDSDFCPLPSSLQSARPQVKNQDLPDEIKQQMKYLASRIGGCVPFARVDLLFGSNERIYLLEVTFSPANGLAKRPVELEMWLGNKWVL